MENIQCTAVRCRGPGKENVLVDFGSECFDRYTIFSKSFFYKIHDSYHNFFLSCNAKQSIMFFSTGIVLFQSTVCSRCPSADFIAPVTMSQIGHVFGGFFRQTSIIYKWNMANNNVFKYYIFFGTDTWKSSTFKICIDNKWVTIFMPLFSQFKLLNMLFSVAVNRLGEIVSPVLLLSWSWLFHSLCALYWAVRVFQDFYAHMFYSFFL